jgi:hypothetical protein
VRIRHLIIAAALTFGFSGMAGASPLAGAAASVEGPATAVELAGWKGRGRHYGWHRGRHYGWYRGRHRGWYRHPGRHYGWYKPRRRVVYYRW